MYTKGIALPFFQKFYLLSYITILPWHSHEIRSNIWNEQIEIKKSKIFSTSLQLLMNRDEKYVLNRSEKPLKPLYLLFSLPFALLHSASSLQLRVITSQFAFEISSFSHHPENVDKSPACFKSLFNQHKIIQFLSPNNFFLSVGSFVS